jgi:hypothetical protein
MKKISHFSILGFLLFLTAVLPAQNETSKWYFGDHAGLNFLTVPPTVLQNSAINTQQGCSSISNAMGSLLFYTDGVTVWNMQHLPMANGTGLLGGYYSSQSALIAKQPGSSTIYYIFTMAALGGTDGMRYSVVDMSLAAGNGSVTVKNVLISTPNMDGLTGVAHCNKTDIWIMTHGLNNSDFKAYLLTAAGINTTAVVSSIGLPHVWGRSIMKFSPDGKKLGAYLCVGLPNFRQEVYTFDDAMGIVTSSLLCVNTASNGYGCEFSPDGTKFYAGMNTGTSPYGIWQWDLNAGSNTAIMNSVVMTGTASGIGALQLAPNGKIYVANNGSLLGVVNSPNMAGLASNYIDNGQSISPATSLSSLPNFVCSLFKQESLFSNSIKDTLIGCRTSSFSIGNSLSGYSSTPTSVNWQFGDPSSGSSNTSNLNQPVHVFSTDGTFNINLLEHFACRTDTIRKVIQIVGSPTLLVISGTKTICEGNSTTLTAAGASSYTWSTGSVYPYLLVTPSVTTAYTVTGHMNNFFCPVLKTVTVTVSPCTGIENNMMTETSFNLFPNPCNGMVNIESSKEMELYLIDFTGKAIKTLDIKTGGNVFDLQHLPGGIYFLKSIISTNPSILTRFIKTD